MTVEILYVLVAVNVASFLAFGMDKHLAINGGRRISEKNLLFLAGAGGSAGAMMGQKYFRHKTRKFKYILPTMFAVHVAIGILATLSSLNG